MTVSETDSHGIADYGAWRKQHFGRLNLHKGNTNIDQVYEELAEMWPKLFDPEREISPSDQLLHIAEVADSLYEIYAYNPFAPYLEQAVTGAANEIMETFFDLPQTRKTFADRQAEALEAEKAKRRREVERVRAQRDARLETLREENRQRVQRAIRREREASARRIARLKDRYQARDAVGRERRTAAELRRKIERHTKELSQKLLRPTDQKHIPEGLRQAVAVMLESINQESRDGARTFTVDPVTKQRVYQPEGTPTRRTEAFLALKEQYSKIVAEGGDLVIDPALFGSDADGIQGGFDAVIAMRDVKLADMTVSQLQTVWQVVKAVERSVTTAGKILSSAKFESTLEWANALSADTASRTSKSSLTQNHALIDLETPYTFFSHFGDSGKAIYRMLRNAQDQQRMMVEEVTGMVQSIAGAETIQNLEKETHKFTTEQART